MYIDFIENLKSKKILDENDIKKLKNYIDIKFKNSTSKEQATILSNTINNIIVNSFKGINNNVKNNLRKSIIKNTLLKNKNAISMYDIFYAISSEEFQDEIATNEIINWIVNSTDIIITKKDIEFFNDKSIINFEEIKDNINLTPFKTSVKNINSNISIEKKINMKTKIKSNYISIFSIKKALLYFLITLLASGYSYTKIYSLTSSKNKRIVNLSQKSTYTSEKIKEDNNQAGIPTYFYYKDINKTKLKIFLKDKNSILQYEPYFSDIISSAKELNLDPLILFAITGQEQSFVPKNHKHAKKIANNPFNVFHSWNEYNTNIKDSSRIAARTVINLCENKPQKENPFKWINRSYAEDKNWWKGVNYFYTSLCKYIH
ncbi:hypothetical protein [Clostridium rectalis]|uniref:hypothetical protein n=1 Tax=Clostridium rectalis TaxID=2040295 RepID=UPI000F63E3FD|nr:hypothetical protein [Clostridium rectalis]